MPSPVFTGDPPRPLFIPGGGDVLVPALADDPCGCCEPAGLELCCINPDNTLTAFVTISGAVVPVGSGQTQYQCTCPQYNGSWAVPMNTRGQTSGGWQFCAGRQCFPDFIDTTCDTSPFNFPYLPLDLLVLVSLEYDSILFPGTLRCRVRLRWTCGSDFCGTLGQGIDANVGSTGVSCQGLSASGDFLFWNSFSAQGFNCFLPACNHTFVPGQQPTVVPASFSVTFQ